MPLSWNNKDADKGLDAAAAWVSEGLAAVPLFAGALLYVADQVFQPIVLRATFTLAFASLVAVLFSRLWQWMGNNGPAGVGVHLGVGAASGLVVGSISGALPATGLPDHAVLMLAGVGGGLWGSFVFWLIHHPAWVRDVETTAELDEMDEQSEQHPS